MGGAERFLVDLVLHLDRDRFLPIIGCLYKEGEWAGRLRQCGIEVLTLGVPKGDISVKGFLIVARFLQKHHPDILHTFLEGNWYGMPSGWFCNVPVRIVSLQNCYWHWSLKLRLFDRFVSQFAHCAIACSRAVADFFCQNVWYPKRKVKVVYNGADPVRFQGLPTKLEVRRALGIPSDEIVLTTVASLTPQKGHETLLQALKYVVAEHPDVLSVLVGDGGLREELQTLCAKLRLSDHVLFMGKRDDVPNILAASDIFVLPSLWEGLGLAVIEAWMVGLPVVVSQVDGLTEIVHEGENGFLVPPNSPKELAERLLRLVEDRQLAIHIGRRGQEIALQRFTIQESTHQIMNIYENLLRTRA